MSVFNLKTNVLLLTVVMAAFVYGLGMVTMPVVTLTCFGLLPMADHLVAPVLVLGPFLGAWLLSVAVLGVYVWFWQSQMLLSGFVLLGAVYLLIGSGLALFGILGPINQPLVLTWLVNHFAFLVLMIILYGFGRSE